MKTQNATEAFVVRSPIRGGEVQHSCAKKASHGGQKNWRPKPDVKENLLKPSKRRKGKEKKVIKIKEMR